MTLILKTKIAKRLGAELISTYGLSEDHAHLIASGIDAGVSNVSTARMLAGLSSDWKDAALIDGAATLRESINAKTNNGYVSYEDNTLVASMKSLHGVGGDDTPEDNPLISTVKSMHGVG